MKIPFRQLLKMMLFGVTAIGIFGLWQSISGAVVFDPSLTDVEMNQACREGFMPL